MTRQLGPTVRTFTQPRFGHAQRSFVDHANGPALASQSVGASTTCQFVRVGVSHEKVFVFRCGLGPDGDAIIGTDTQVRRRCPKLGQWLKNDLSVQQWRRSCCSDQQTPPLFRWRARAGASPQIAWAARQSDHLSRESGQRHNTGATRGILIVGGQLNPTDRRLLVCKCSSLDWQRLRFFVHKPAAYATGLAGFCVAKLHGFEKR